MIRLSKLKAYAKNESRVNRRTGQVEVEALDTKGKNPVRDIFIPDKGYVLKPNEIYIVEVDNPGSQSFRETNFRTDLLGLGISCKVLDDECYITVQRSVRVYKNMGMFYEEKT